MSTTCELFDRDALVKIGFPQYKDGIVFKTAFLLGLNKRIKQLESEGNKILSVGYVSGAYSDPKALITFSKEESE